MADWAGGVDPVPRPVTFGGVRAMWVIAMFDLPVDTKEARREYVRFRNALLDDAFIMLQFSVYGRPCPSEENAQMHAGRVAAHVPPGGEVRILTLTDLQYSRMKIFLGRRKKSPEEPPAQLSFF